MRGLGGCCTCSRVVQDREPEWIVRSGSVGLRGPTGLGLRESGLGVSSCRWPSQVRVAERVLRGSVSGYGGSVWGWQLIARPLNTLQSIESPVLLNLHRTVTPTFRNHSTQVRDGSSMSGHASQ